MRLSHRHELPAEKIHRHAYDAWPATRQSGRDVGAALTTTVGQDASAGAGAHAKTESVLLGTTTIVWLVRTLTHWEILHDYVAEPGRRSEMEVFPRKTAFDN